MSQTSTTTDPIAQLRAAGSADKQTSTTSSRFGLRAFTSMLLSISFSALCISGIILFLTPRGRTANWTGWTLLGLDKHEWTSLHVNNSILFIAVAAIHLFLNWSVLMRYLSNKKVPGIHKKKELFVALCVAIVCVAGPIYSIPPFSSVMDLNEDVKDYWEQDTARGNAQPPVAHAEELTLAGLADQIFLTEEQVATALENKGFDVSNPYSTVFELALQQEMTPSEMFEVIREAYPESRGWGKIGSRPEGHEEGDSEAADHSERGSGFRGGQGQGRGQGGGGQGGGMGQGRGQGGGQGRGRGQGLGEGAW